MKINYYSNLNGEKVTKDVTGKEEPIPSIYFSYFIGDHFGNGTGWLELPEALVESIRKNHNIDFKGTVDSVAPLPKMDAKGNINTTLPATNGLHVSHTGEIKLGGGDTYPQPKPNIVVADKSKFTDDWGDSKSVPPHYHEGFAGDSKRMFQEQVDAHVKRMIASFNVDQMILNGLPTKTVEDAFIKLRQELKKRNSPLGHSIITDGSINTFDGRVKAMALLGFHRKTNNKWWHHILGEDQEQNWLTYDPTQQPFSDITTMLFKSGFVKGQRKVRMDIKAALDIR